MIGLHDLRRRASLAFGVARETVRATPLEPKEEGYVLFSVGVLALSASLREVPEEKREEAFRIFQRSVTRALTPTDDAQQDSR